MIGVVLAGGLGRRMGAAKANMLLGGRPLIAYPIDALAAACERVVVVAKRNTELPELGIERWDEPDEPRHPLAGIAYALERAAAPILVCAADMPFADADVLDRIAGTAGTGPTAAVAACAGQIEPLLAAYPPNALGALRAAPANAPLRRTVESLAPALVEVDPAVVFNVNTPDDLAEAERRLRS